MPSSNHSCLGSLTFDIFFLCLACISIFCYFKMVLSLKFLGCWRFGGIPIWITQCTWNNYSKIGPPLIFRIILGIWIALRTIHLLLKESLERNMNLVLWSILHPQSLKPKPTSRRGNMMEGRKKGREKYVIPIWL